MEIKIAKTTGERSKLRRDNENAVAVMCGYPSVRKMLTAMIAARGDSLGLDVVCVPLPPSGNHPPSIKPIVTPSLRSVYPPESPPQPADAQAGGRSRSVARREAAQRGETSPEFDGGTP